VSRGKNTMSKTYNSGYSLVVTHLTTNPPVRCLNRAERTGSLVFNVLWSYVECRGNYYEYDE
jgi:soluble lytic murein transglycosylase-like protein